MAHTPRRKKSPVRDEIVNAIGPEAALSLLSAFGGTQVYIPGTKPGPNNRILQVIGPAAVAKLMATSLANNRITLPKASLVDLVARETGTAGAVAIKLRTSERTVRRIRQQLGAKGRRVAR